MKSDVYIFSRAELERIIFDESIDKELRISVLKLWLKAYKSALDDYFDFIRDSKISKEVFFNQFEQGKIDFYNSFLEVIEND